MKRQFTNSSENDDLDITVRRTHNHHTRSHRRSVHTSGRRVFHRVLAVFFAIILGAGGIFAINQIAKAIDIGGNPNPDVDICVNVPSDYPGTFLDFKRDLLDQLQAKGMDTSKVRITNTMIDVDTSDLSNWYIFDHYYNQAQYNNLISRGKIKGGTTQPFRQADTSNITEGDTGLYDLATNTVIATNRNFRSHSTNYTTGSGDNIKSNMLFAGYGAVDLVDFMLYPAPSDSKRSFSFDMDGSSVYDALDGAGFLLNAAVENNRLYGYFLHINGSGAVSIKKVNGADLLKSASSATAERSEFIGTQQGALSSITWPAHKKIRLSVELTSSKVTVQYQPYSDASKSSLGDAVTLGSLNIPQFGKVSRNMFGPIVCYSSHGCTQCTSYRFDDLVMSYQPSAFDALKSTAYSQSAQQKYFINLAGASGDPSVNYDDTTHYIDGIKRMQQNHIFYLSNVNDGHVVKNNAYNGSTITDYGNGVNNGAYYTNDDFIERMAEYIKDAYDNNKEYEVQVGADSGAEEPVANFYTGMDDNGRFSQVVLVHQNHLGTDTLNIKPKDLSIASGSASINNWHYKITSPSGGLMLNTDYTSKAAFEAAAKAFKKGDAPGLYTFELTVSDTADKTSTPYTCQMMMYRDNVAPTVTVTNSTAHGGVGNAIITMTDAGDGIEADGVTITPNKGSGIAKYALSDGDASAAPAEDDWITLETPVHEYVVTQDFNDFARSGMKVWVKDECGNSTTSTAVQPCEVTVKDANGDTTQEYTTVKGKVLGSLPSTDEVIYTEDDHGVMKEEYFAGWSGVDGSGNHVDVTENTIVSFDKLVLTPIYTSEKAYITFNGNGGTVNHDLIDAAASTSRVEVSAGATLQNIIDKFTTNQHLVAEKTGYSFKEWTVDAGGNTKITTQRMAQPSAGTPDEKTVYAQYTINTYKLKFDPNGGIFGSVREKDKTYNSTVTTDITSLAGRQLPQKAGYLFDGWCLDPNNPVKITNSTTVKIPASDLTVYAMWKDDPNKFHVTLKSVETKDESTTPGTKGANCSKNSEISFPNSYVGAGEKYADLAAKAPTCSGYVFEGWYYVAKGQDGSYTLPRNQDGTVQTTGSGAAKKVVDGTAFSNIISSAADHTLIANWKPATDTQYKILYYFNNGEKTGKTYTVQDGDVTYKKDVFNYSEAKNESVAKIGTTEQVITLAEGASAGQIKSEITVDGVSYWHNPNAAVDLDNSGQPVTGEVSTGAIIGDPGLQLKLYYDRYLSINHTEVGNGSGTVTGDNLNKIKEGETPGTVNITADDGSYISHVYINGNIRDDCIAEDGRTGQVRYSGGLYEDASIKVEFTQGTTPEPPQPDPAYPDDPAFVTITTKLNGNVDGTCKLTGTQTLEAGSDATVKLDLAADYQFVSAKVDGVDYEYADVLTSTGIAFNGLKGNHTVEVTVEKLASMGGDVVEGQYTITCNKYDGDVDVQLSPSAVVDPGSTYEVTWAPSDNYEIYRICIDGSDVDTGGTAWKVRKKYKFSNIKANHVVDVYFVRKPAQGQDPEVPLFSVYKKITTKIEGGPGTTSPNAMVKSGESYDVTWTIQNTETNPDSINYTNYSLKSLSINGQEVTLTDAQKTAGKYTISSVTEDKDVVVELEQKKYTVALYAIGDCDISTWPSLIEGQNFTNLTATPKQGNVIAKIDIDGVTIWDNPTVSVGNSVNNLSVHSINAAAPKADSADSTSDSSDSSDATVPESDYAEDEPKDSGILSAIGDAIDSVVNFIAPDNKAYAAGAGDEVTITHAPDASNKTASLKISGTSQNHNITFYTAEEKGTDDTGKTVIDPLPDPADLLNVTATMIDTTAGGTSQITGVAPEMSGSGKYAEGSDVTIEWKIPAGYKYVNATVDGDAGSAGYDAATGKYTLTLSEISAAHDVKINVKKDVKGDTVAPVEPTVDGTFYKVRVETQGPVTAGHALEQAVASAKTDIAWSVNGVDNLNYITKYVFIDGINNPEFVAQNSGLSGSTELSVAGKDHYVKVVADQRMPTNIDTNGDGDADFIVGPTLDGAGHIIPIPGTSYIEYKNPDYDGDGIVDYYKIAFDANKGSGSTEVAGSMENMKLDVNADATALSDNAFSRSGYTWKGWTVDSGDGQGDYINKQQVRNLSVTQNATVTMKSVWEANKYNISFDANVPQDATSTLDGSMADEECTFDVQPKLTKNAYTLPGYTFTGWNTEANGNGTAYSDEEADNKVMNLRTGDKGADDAETLANSKITLYAQWSANSYIVKYNANKPATASHNIEGTMADSTYTYDVDAALRTNAYTLEGWSFMGWSTDSTATEATYEDAKVVRNLSTEANGETTLYAVWAPNGYYVKFDANKPSNASAEVQNTMQNQRIVFDVTVPLNANTMTLTGWTFTGWNSSADGSGTAYADKEQVSDLSSVTNGEYTVYAQWTVNTYVVHFDGNKGSGSTDIEGSMSDQNFTYDAAEAALTQNAFSREGYEWAAWNTAADDSGTSYTNAKEVKNLNSDANGTFTLYAVWRPHTYSFKFDGNKPESSSSEVEGVMSDQDFAFDASDPIKTCAYTQTGYTFTGWNTLADGSGTTYTDGQDVLNYSSTEGDSLQLYAQWTPNKYTVKFGGGADGVSGSMQEIECTYDVPFNVSLNELKRVGYTFAGWRIEEPSMDSDSSLPDVPSLVSLKADDASSDESDDTPSSEDESAELGKDWKVGDIIKDGDKVVNLLTKDGSSLELAATWDANKYTVKFDANGGDGTMTAVNCTYDAEFKLPKCTMTRAGYEFVGWASSKVALSSNFKDEQDGLKNLSSEPNGEVTLYALWNALPASAPSMTPATGDDTPDFIAWLYTHILL